jgi:membrane protein insertase Oxa1/YidC/SpoIIIJ
VDPERCGLSTTEFFAEGSEDAHGTLFDAYLKYPIVTVEPGAEQRWSVLSYFGPKDWNMLETAGHELTEVVNLGTLAVIARFFARILGWIHGWSGNWGLAIILLTLMVRIALYPIDGAAVPGDGADAEAQARAGRASTSEVRRRSWRSAKRR